MAPNQPKPYYASGHGYYQPQGMTVNYRMPFDPNSPQYKCCCDTVHVKVGACVVAVLECIGLIILTGYGIWMFLNVHNNLLLISVPAVTTSMALIISVGAIIVLIIGISKEASLLLLIHLVYQIALAICAVIGVLMSAMIIASGKLWVIEQMGGPSSHHLQEMEKELFTIQDTDAQTRQTVFIGIGLMVMCLLAAVVQIWFFWIVKGCYNYFKDKTAYGYEPGKISA